MTIPEGWESVNSNGERYFLATSLRTFRHSVNVEYPNRDFASDGWIGDAAHAARVSDHNPCWSCTAPYRGIVRAIDVTNDPTIPEIRERILYSAIGHDAVWYVISNGKIYSRTHDWKELDYTGANGHYHHVHISLNHDVASYNDTTLVLKRKVQDAVATLDKEDLTAIEGIVQRYSAFNAKNLSQRIDDIAAAAARAVDASLADDFSAVEAAVAAAKSELDKLPKATV